MRRALTVSSFVVGLSLLAIALLAPPASGTAVQERVLRLNLNHTDINYLDPALNYDFYGWRLEAATCAMLLNYPDKAGPASARLVPEVAAGFPRVSNGGKTYTFTIKSGFRFSDGTPVTAESFARAIERALHPKMQSPGATFLSDVVGADKVLAGKATRPAGVKVKGNTLAITLTRVAPDFLSRLAMPFFCSVPSNLPIEPKGVNTPPGAGPYYVATKEPGRLMVLKRNPFYKGGRKQNWDEIRITANVDENASYLQVRKGEADLDLIGLPASAHSALTKEFGINKSRYFVYPSAVTGYYALNTSRGIFKDPDVRKAVNFAIDRPALIRLRGANAGTANDQILPPGIPGYRDAKIYPLDRPNVERAKKLLGGKTGTVVLYTLNDTTAQNDAQILQANLKAIGLELEIKQFTFATMLDKAGTRGEPFDMEAIAWFADYPDPYDFVNILLYGETITKNHNVNTSYFDDPAYNRKMEAAAKLSGDERFRTYAKLDADIMRNAAPLAVVYNQNVREFISDKVGCPTWTFAWGGLNLVLLCPKK